MPEDAFYDEVAKELQDKKLVPGVWAKAFEQAGGELERARVLYIKYRVEQLAKKASEQALVRGLISPDTTRMPQEYPNTSIFDYRIHPAPPHSLPAIRTRSVMQSDMRDSAGMTFNFL